MRDKDPWKHRSSGMKCKTCMWFAPKKVVRADLDSELSNPVKESPVYHLGRCRRRCPTMNGYPVVFVNDWCGDHKLNEEVL